MIINFECFFANNYLEGNDTNTSRLRDNGASIGSRIGSVFVARGPSSGFGDLGWRVREDVVALVSEALLVRVEVGDHSPRDAGEGVVLNEDLGAHTAVDTGDTAVVARAVDVGGTEADRGETRVDALEVVVVVSDAQLTLVFGAIVVRMTNERTLPLLYR